MVGSKIKIVKNGEIKTISEIETIDGVDVFYMSDGTSYVGKQISFDYYDSYSERNNEKIITETFEKSFSKNESLNNGMISFINYVMTTSDEIRKSKQELKKKEKKQSSLKIFGCTITFSKSK